MESQNSTLQPNSPINDMKYIPDELIIDIHDDDMKSIPDELINNIDDYMQYLSHKYIEKSLQMIQKTLDENLRREGL